MLHSFVGDYLITAALPISCLKDYKLPSTYLEKLRVTGVKLEGCLIYQFLILAKNIL